MVVQVTGNTPIIVFGLTKISVKPLGQYLNPPPPHTHCIIACVHCRWCSAPCPCTLCDGNAVMCAARPGAGYAGHAYCTLCQTPYLVAYFHTL
jgi:hypothetical protein